MSDSLQCVDSEAGQIFFDAFCGGGDTNEGYYNTAVPLSSSAVNMIKAAIFMGDPRYRYGFSYEVGTCAAQGVSTVSRHYFIVTPTWGCHIPQQILHVHST